MEDNKNNIQNEDEAFDFLLNRLHDEKRKEEWTKAMGSTSEYNAKKSTKQKSIPSKKFFIKITSVAACLLLLFSISFWVMNPNQTTSSLAMRSIEETNINIQYNLETRGTSIKDVNNVGLKKELAKALYDNDFSQAVGIFRVFEKQSRLEIRDKFFFATSLLKIRDEDHYKSISLLTDIVKLEGELYEEALWFRALAYGMIENDINMKIDLKTIIEESNYQKEQAISIYAKIN